MSRRTAAEWLDEAAKHPWTLAHAMPLLREACELAKEDNNELSAFAYLSEAYVQRLHRTIQMHMEHLREQDFATAAQWRTESMAKADQSLDDARIALRFLA
jgi:phage terminase small subunit